MNITNLFKRSIDNFTATYSFCMLYFTPKMPAVHIWTIESNARNNNNGIVRVRRHGKINIIYLIPISVHNTNYIAHVSVM